MRPVWMVTHQDLRRAAKIRLVSNAIVEAFERDAAILRYGRPRKRRDPVPSLTQARSISKQGASGAEEHDGNRRKQASGVGG